MIVKEAFDLVWQFGRACENVGRAAEQHNIEEQQLEQQYALAAKLIKLLSEEQV